MLTEKIVPRNNIHTVLIFKVLSIHHYETGKTLHDDRIFTDIEVENVTSTRYISRIISFRVNHSVRAVCKIR